MNKKVDTESLQEIAAEEWLSDYLPSLFRWSADINSAVWKSTDSSITDKLLGAITIKPGRPSFAITQQEEK